MKEIFRRKILSNLGIGEEDLDEYIQQFFVALNATIRPTTKFNNFTDEKKLDNIRSRMQKKYNTLCTDEDDQEEYENLFQTLVAITIVMRDDRLDQATKILTNKSRKQVLITCMTELVQTLVVLPDYTKITA